MKFPIYGKIKVMFQTTSPSYFWMFLVAAEFNLWTFQDVCLGYLGWLVKNPLDDGWPESWRSICSIVSIKTVYKQTVH